MSIKFGDLEDGARFQYGATGLLFEKAGREQAVSFGRGNGRPRRGWVFSPDIAVVRVVAGRG